MTVAMTPAIPLMLILMGKRDGRMGDGSTHIGVPAHLLNDIFMEMTSVSQEAAGNVVGMSQALKDGIITGEGSLAAFP